MSSIRVSAAGFAVVGLWFALAGDRSSVDAQGNAVNRFYRCESGWTFESGTNAARCRRGGGVQTAAMLACPQATLPTGQRVGTAYRQDYNGQKDMCVTEVPGAALIGLEIPCPVTYNKVIQVGRDTCVRPNPIEVKAPSIAVQQSQ
jgi:hypothetical protein